MAKVYITEFDVLQGIFATITAQMALTPPVVEQTPITTTGASAQSAAFGTTTNIVRIHTDGIISIAFGPNPTATTNTMRMSANQTEYFGVKPLQKVALITNT